MNLTTDELRETIHLACAGLTHLELQDKQRMPGVAAKIRPARILVTRLLELQRLDAARNEIGSSPKPPEPILRAIEPQRPTRDTLLAILWADWHANAGDAGSFGDIGEAFQFTHDKMTDAELEKAVQNLPAKPKDKFGAPSGIVKAAQEDYDMRKDPRVDPSCYEPPGPVGDLPWTYSRYRALIRYKGKPFAVCSPNGRDALSTADETLLLNALNYDAVQMAVRDAEQNDMGQLQADSDYIIKQVQERAYYMVRDNAVSKRTLTAPIAVRLFESAMLVGASIAMERSTSKLLGEHLQQLASAHQPQARGESDGPAHTE